MSCTEVLILSTTANWEARIQSDVGDGSSEHGQKVASGCTAVAVKDKKGKGKQSWMMIRRKLHGLDKSSQIIEPS